MSRRITAAIAGVVLVTLLLCGTGTFVLARVVNHRREVRQLETKALNANQLLTSVADAIVPGPNARSSARIAAIRTKLLEALSVNGIGQGTITANGTFYGDLPGSVRASDLDPAQLADGQVQSGRRGNLLWAAAGTPTTGVNGRTRWSVTVVTATQERFFGPTFRWFVISGTLAALFAAAVAGIVGRRLARPVQAAVEATQSIASGDLSVRLPEQPGSDDELAALARSINQMAGDLERAHEQERQFLLSVSHDLRTPLTSIRGYAEGLVDHAVDPDRAGVVIGTEAARLERLVGDLLDLARLDAQRFTLDPQPANVVDIVAGTVHGFAPELADAGIQLFHELDQTPPSQVLVDVDRFAQVIANLLNNALGYARTSIWVTVQQEAGPGTGTGTPPANGTRAGDGLGTGTVTIDITDDGPGIPAADLPHVFDRLHQADNQADRRAPGTGLGLAIVAELVQRMHGQVSVQSTPGTGTVFRLQFPTIGPG